ncbi:MAG: DUF1266 domain-containing protein [Oscillospiraceae bacterium]|nr:DUF1266 domain-containing protein [Oscillospiraceae bacterium]
MAKIKDLINPSDLQMWEASAQRGEEDGIMVMAGLELDENDPNLMDYPPFIAAYGLKRAQKPGEDLGLWVNSGLARKAEKDFPATPEQRRLLAFGCVQLAKNLAPCRTLHITDDEDRVDEMLRNYWGIEDAEEALETATKLAQGEIHTDYTNEFYRTLVKSGKTEITVEDLYGYVNDYSLRRTIAKGLRSVSEQLGIGIYHTGFVPSGSFFNSLADVIMNGHVFGKCEFPEVFGEEDKEKIKELSDKYRPQFVGLILEKLAEKINETLGVYQKAYSFLLEQGYTEEELAKIDTIAAWDYGRTAIVVRYGVKMGFFEEAQAWQLLQTAADNAQGLYSNWREYLAAYIFGRAIAFEQSSGDYNNVVEYLLNDELSPYRECAFKSDETPGAAELKSSSNSGQPEMRNITTTELPQYKGAEYINIGNGVFRDTGAKKFRYVTTIRFELANAEDSQQPFEEILEKYSVNCTEHILESQKDDGTIVIEAEIEAENNVALDALDSIRKITNLVGKWVYNKENAGGLGLVIEDKFGGIVTFAAEAKAQQHQAEMWALLNKMMGGAKPD